MRFWSIWNPGYPMALSEKIERTKDWAAMELERLLPKRAAYWVAMVQIGRATMTSQNVPATSLDNVLDNLGRVKDGKPLKQFKWDESKRYSEDEEFSLLPDGEIPSEQQVIDIQTSVGGLITPTNSKE